MCSGIVQHRRSGTWSNRLAADHPGPPDLAGPGAQAGAGWYRDAHLDRSLRAATRPKVTRIRHTPVAMADQELALGVCRHRATTTRSRSGSHTAQARTQASAEEESSRCIRLGERRPSCARSWRTGRHLYQRGVKNRQCPVVSTRPPDTRPGNIRLTQVQSAHRGHAPPGRPWTRYRITEYQRNLAAIFRPQRRSTDLVNAEHQRLGWMNQVRPATEQQQHCRLELQRRPDAVHWLSTWPDPRWRSRQAGTGQPQSPRMLRAEDYGAFEPCEAQRIAPMARSWALHCYAWSAGVKHG